MDETSRFVNLCCVPGIYASDLPDGKVELLKTVLSLKYSQKPLIASCETAKSAAESIEFIRDFYGEMGEYFTIGVENVISPLRYSREDVAATLAYVKRNQPVVITCCSAPGMTSPITVAVSYTHLDVYKRQGYQGSAYSEVFHASCHHVLFWKDGCRGDHTTGP